MRSALSPAARWVCGLVGVALVNGCCPSPPMAEPAADLAPSADLGTNMGPSCKAAEGLAADNRLLCVDFTTKLPDAQAG